MLPEFEKDLKNFSELAEKLFEFEANREVSVTILYIYMMILNGTFDTFKEKINELVEKHKLLSETSEYTLELIKGSGDKIVFPAMKKLIEETTSKV